MLADLYAKMKDQPMKVDLADLWKQLGIESDGKTVRLIDDAPLAAVRRAITSPEAATKPAQAASISQPSTVFAGRAVGSSRQSDEP